ncbi:MAG: DUF6850 family outer membrane beta-barrel protein [Rikenellaceae bacterium]
MNNLKQIFALVAALCCIAYSASGQLYEQVESRNIWNMGNNVTGLLRDSITVSTAELYTTYNEGAFRNFSDASSLWSAGTVAKTLTHHDNLSMIGEFSYSHTAGKDMSGSMFITPNNYPIDVLEFTPGDKTLQNYYFMGGLATEILPNLNVGVMGEFRSQNYAKYKDLRHYNYRMDLRFAPSVSYTFGGATLGATYIYTKNSETIRAKEIGTAADSYDAFLDKGLMMGAYEDWEGSGIHLSESGVDGLPVAESGNGVALQVDYAGFYVEAEYLHAKGVVGEKQTIWYNFPSNSYTARLGYTLSSGGNTHIISLEANQYQIVNNENVVNDEYNNGVTTTVVYGSNQIYTSEQFTLTPQYNLLFGSGAQLLAGAVYYNQKSQSTLMYPYVDELTLHYTQAYLGGMVPIGAFELRGQLSWMSGGWDDDSYTVEVDEGLEYGDKQTQLEEYYNIGNEYLTATQVSSSISLRYNTRNSFFCEIGGVLTKAFDLQYIDGDSRWGTTFKIGYNF